MQNLGRSGRPGKSPGVRTSPLVTFLKTKNGDIRHVPLNTDALTALRVLVKSDEGTGCVLPRQPYRAWFDRALTEAKIENFRPHDMRHRFASRLEMSGVDFTTVGRLLGHKTLTMTLRYAHLAPQHLADAVSKLVGFGSIQPSIHVAGAGA